MGLRRGWAVMALPLLLAGCGSSRSDRPAPAARRLTVVASLFPLAEVARRVGLDRVTVIDLTPPGADPRTVSGSGAPLDGAVALVLGRGYQPAVEAVVIAGSARAKAVVAVADDLGANQPEVWLDPAVMVQVTHLVASALSRADPAGQAAYRDGARAYVAQLGALDIGYRTSLADCARRDVVTADGVFSPMARRYGFRDHQVGEAGIVGLIHARGVPTVFTEPLVPPGPALALAHAAHAKVDSLATLETRTPGEATRGASYLSLMADNLAKLRAALACTSGAGA